MPTMKAVSMTLREDQFESIIELSRQLNISKSEVVRLALDNMIFLYDLLSDLGLGNLPSKLIQPKIEKINNYMEAWKNANNMG